MQGAVGILRALTLILTSALILASASISAQDSDFELLDGGGLTVEGYGDEFGDPSDDSRQGAGSVNWERSRWTFAATAGLPRARYPESLVVKVMFGSLAFQVGDEDVVIVDPDGSSIHILNEPTGDPLMVDVTPTDEHVQDQGGGDCISLCMLEPGQTVRIEQGFTVYLPGNVTCFFCNITQGTATNEAILMVIAAVPADSQPFTWTRMMGVDFATTATPVAVEVGSREALLKADLPGVYVGCM